MPDKLSVQIEDISKNSDICAHSTNAIIFREHIGREVNLFDFIGFSDVLNTIPLSRKRTEDEMYSNKALVYIFEKLKNCYDLEKDEYRLVVSSLSLHRTSFGFVQLKAKQKALVLSNLQKSFFEKSTLKGLIKFIIALIPGSLPIEIVDRWRIYQDK